MHSDPLAAAARRLPAARRLALAVLLGLAGPARAGATTYTWDGGSGTTGNWTDAANWNPDGAPVSAVDTALTFTGSTRLANVNDLAGSFLLNALLFDANAGAFTLSGNALDFRTNGSTLPTLTQASAAAVSIANYITLTNNLTVATTGAGGLSLGGIISGSGSLTKTGAGTLTLTVANTYTGSTTISAGTLALTGSGSLTSGAGTALTVDGTAATPASLMLASGTSVSQRTAYIGNVANGVGSVAQSGGTFSTNNSSLYVGYLAGSSGAYTLSAGSLATGQAIVGNSGTGTFTQSGGSFTTGGNILYISFNGGRGAYTLSGGSLSTGSAYIGSSGTGTFTQSGGTFTTGSNNDFTLGAVSGSSGTYTLSGTGSLSTGSAFVGFDGTGTFTQSGGTFTTNTKSLLFGFDSGSGSGTFNLDGGTLTTAKLSRGPGTGTFNFNGGTLRPAATNTTFFQGLTTANVRNGGAIVNTNGFDITVAQALLHSTIGGDAATDGGLTKQGTGTLTLTGTSTYTGATTVSAGTLAVSHDGGAAPGRLSATGAIVVSNGGTLLLSGSTAVSDRLNDAAPVTLNGGGKLTTASGVREGAVPTAANGAGGAAGLGALTLTATTTTLRASFDFGNTAGGSALVFSSLDASAKGAFVNVLDWSGLARGDNGATTNDRLLFVTDPGFTTADLAKWQFSNDTGVNFPTGGLEIAYNGYYEIVPVPEPGTVAGGLLALGALTWGGGRRLARRRRVLAGAVCA